MAQDQEPDAKSSTRSPVLFLVILGLIIFFLAAFLMLRSSGSGATPNSPSTTKPASSTSSMPLSPTPIA